MPESAHSLSTCRIPLSALTYYYRRNLVGGRPAGGAASVGGRRRTVRVAFDATQAELVVTIVEFAAHTAYLERSTGIGLLVVPRPDLDLVSPIDWFPEVAWSGAEGVFGPANGLSLQTADRAHALEQLKQGGWTLLDNANDNDRAEPAGRTADGRLAVCLCAEQGSDRGLVLEDLQHAITALHTAADLRHER